MDIDDIRVKESAVIVNEIVNMKGFVEKCQRNVIDGLTDCWIDGLIYRIIPGELYQECCHAPSIIA